MNFNDWLQRKMDEQGVTPKKLAAACEVTTSAVSRWLTGERLPERRQVAFLSKFFGVSPSTILWMTDKEALQQEIENGMSQQEIAALLAHVPEVEEFYRILGSLPVDKRAALILIARSMAEGEKRPG